MRQVWGAGSTPTPWRAISGARTEDSEGGFSLIEVIIVALILPVVIGAISFALIAIFSLQGGTSSRISASGDAQVVSSNFESDVQDSSYVTTSSTATGGPAPCESSAQILNADVVVLGLQINTSTQVTQGLQSGNGQTEVTYLEVPSGTVAPITYKLIRNICQGGAATTPVGTSTVSYSVPSPTNNTVSITCDAALVAALPTGTPITSLIVAPLTTAVANGDKIKVGTGTTAVTFTTNTSSLVPAATSVAAGATSIPVTSQTLTTTGVPAGTTAVDSSWPANCGAGSSWISTASVTGVGFATTGTGSSPYAYNLTAVPRPGATSVQPTTVSSPNSSCVFATGIGTYTSSLCFVDLSAWNSYSGTSSAACPGAGLAMKAGINRTAEILTFCLNVKSVVTVGGAAVSGASNGGYNGVKAIPFPTYSGAFLGNNGFYTVASTQAPALDQTDTTVGKTTTVTISNIVVSDPSGNVATGWELVTGDAETTDTSESMTWQANQALNLLPNTPLSPVGNACESSPPTTSATFLTGLGTTTVKCSATDSSNKTGTVMLYESPAALTPASLTVTMVGTGLEGMFLGVMLPYTSS